MNYNITCIIIIRKNSLFKTHLDNKLCLKIIKFNKFSKLISNNLY